MYLKPVQSLSCAMYNLRSPQSLNISLQYDKAYLLSTYTQSAHMLAAHWGAALQCNSQSNP